MLHLPIQATKASKPANSRKKRPRISMLPARKLSDIKPSPDLLLSYQKTTYGLEQVAKTADISKVSAIMELNKWCSPRNSCRTKTNSLAFLPSIVNSTYSSSSMCFQPSIVNFTYLLYNDKVCIRSTPFFSRKIFFLSYQGRLYLRKKILFCLHSLQFG